jgi:hypothetical protein
MSVSVEMETRSLSEYAREPVDSIELAKQVALEGSACQEFCASKISRVNPQDLGEVRASRDTVGSDPERSSAEAS